MKKYLLVLTIIAVLSPALAFAQDEAFASNQAAARAECMAAGDAAAKPFIAQVGAAVQSGNGEAGGAAAAAAILASADACKAAGTAREAIK